MARPTREFRHPDLSRAIVETAWRQISETGAVSLSLRAIARDLQITAPAIYNYYPRRDDLVTALIIEAHTSFGDSQLAASAELPTEDVDGRLRAIGLAYRDWALAHPQRYELIFGAPIPGYHPPLTLVLPARACSMTALVTVIEDAQAAGRLRLNELPQPATPDGEALAMWRHLVGRPSPAGLSVALLICARVHGLGSLEIGGHLPPFGPTPDQLYDYELSTLKKQFIHTEPPDLVHHRSPTPFIKE